jgi:hypothetical protein
MTAHRPPLTQEGTMQSDLHLIIASQYAQDRIAEATAARQAREVARRGRSRSGPRARWGLMRRHTPAEPLPPTVAASLAPRSARPL